MEYSGCSIVVDPGLARQRPREIWAREHTPAADVSDEALVARMADSDDAALDEFYTRYGRVAYGLALRIVRDPTLAEDAVQEAFLDLWRSAGRFAPARAQAWTWILSIVHPRAVDVVRRHAVRAAEPLPVGENSAGSSAADDEVVLRVERQRVQQALRELTHEQREVLELAYYGGLTQSELAARLGVPIGTVKSRMFTGLARLRVLLGS
jgi:RNA polymerase sigma factor (sigma-70 family)